MFARHLLLCSLLLGVSPIARSEPQSDLTQEARNKAVATRVFEDIFNQGRFEVANEIYSPDFKYHALHATAGLQEDQEAVHAEKKAFPDLRMQVERLVAEGDLVAAMWVFRGTHSGSWFEGLPPTGTPLEFRGITIWRIVDGRIQDEWGSIDEVAAYAQVVRHVQTKLWLALVVLLAMIIAIERLVWAGVRRFVRRPGRMRDA